MKVRNILGLIGRGKIMFSDELINKIDKFLNKNLSIVFDFKFNGLLLFYGDSLKRVMIDDDVDSKYEFVLLCYEEDNVAELLKRNKFKYKYDENNGYYFKYKKMDIYIRIVNDLCYVCNYSTDFLFYDVLRRQIISFGAKTSILRREIIDYNEIEKSDRSDLKLAIKFINYFSDGNKKIKFKIMNKGIYFINKLRRFFRG